MSSWQAEYYRNFNITFYNLLGFLDGAAGSPASVTNALGRLGVDLAGDETSSAPMEHFRCAVRNAGGGQFVERRSPITLYECRVVGLLDPMSEEQAAQVWQYLAHMQTTSLQMDQQQSMDTEGGGSAAGMEGLPSILQSVLGNVAADSGLSPSQLLASGVRLRQLVQGPRRPTSEGCAGLWSGLSSSSLVVDCVDLIRQLSRSIARHMDDHCWERLQLIVEDVLPGRADCTGVRAALNQMNARDSPQSYIETVVGGVWDVAQRDRSIKAD